MIVDRCPMCRGGKPCALCGGTGYIAHPDDDDRADTRDDSDERGVA